MAKKAKKHWGFTPNNYGPPLMYEQYSCWSKQGDLGLIDINLKVLCIGPLDGQVFGKSAWTVGGYLAGLTSPRMYKVIVKFLIYPIHR